MTTIPANQAATDPSTNRTVRPAVLILIATILAYLPAFSGAFIWNDSDYVTAPELRTLRGLARIWTEVGATQQYYPLLHSAFWLQYRLFGDHPLGYHIITVLLHAGAAVLFALVLRRLLLRNAARSEGAEWFAALLFALHPVHVESVAWITEQKNTLSLVLYLAAALVYLRFDENRRPRDYAGALTFFTCSLLAKTATSTLPAALLLVLWWRHGRLRWRRDVLPLLPWLALGAVAGIFSSWVERTYVGAQGADFDSPLSARILVAGRTVWFYAGKLIWPSQLNFIYPRWAADSRIWWQWLFPIGVVALAGVLWNIRRRARGALTAYLFFAGSLFPVMGFVNLYGARYSWVWDHWQYLPDLGPIALAATGLAASLRSVSPHLRQIGVGLVALLLGTLTWSHCGVFHDNQTLFCATIARNPGAWMAHDNLGCELAKIPGRLPEAIGQYEETLRLKSDAAEAHNNLGLALMKMPGRSDEAIAHYKEALRIMPDFVDAHYNLGNALSKTPGRVNEAVTQYEEAIHLKPDYVEAHINLGSDLLTMPGRFNDSINQFAEALRLQPDNGEAHNDLGLALLTLPERASDAIAHFKEALRINPALPSAHFGLGLAWLETPGRLEAAIAEIKAALRLNPDYAQAHYFLAVALIKETGHRDEAEAQLDAALGLEPQYGSALRLLHSLRETRP